MSLLIDKFGRPIMLFDTSSTKQRVKSAEGTISNILAARGIAITLKSSMISKEWIKC